VHTEATRTERPSYKRDDLNNVYIKDSVIPACEDAEGDEFCY
jgi:hypothetical protein